MSINITVLGKPVTVEKLSARNVLRSEHIAREDNERRKQQRLVQVFICILEDRDNQHQLNSKFHLGARTVQGDRLQDKKTGE